MNAITGFRCPVCDSVLHVYGRDQQPQPPVPIHQFLSKRIDEIKWDKRVGVRIMAVCSYDGIVTIADLVKRSERELLREPNFGRRSIEEIKRVLAEQNLHLGMGQNDRSF